MHAVTAILFLFSLFSLAFTAAPVPHYSRQFSGTQTGQATWYGVGLGACGIVSADSDYMTAISYLIFDNYPGYNGVNTTTNPVCGRQIEMYYQDQGQTVTVTILDRCAACATTDLNLSPAAFQALTGNLGLGRVSGVTWTWL